MLVMCSNTPSSEVLQDMLEVCDAGTMEHCHEDQLFLEVCVVLLAF